MSKKRRRDYESNSRFQDFFPIAPKNKSQELLGESIKNNYCSLGIGCAGTGKSLITVYEGVRLLKNRLVDKILYLKPNVGLFQEKGIGFLPGELEEKTLPLLAPVLDNLDAFCSKGFKDSLIKQKKIEYGLLEYLRGRSLNHTYVILDEAQNASKHAILTCLSRISDTSKIVILGDPNQCDLPPSFKSGLTDAGRRLKGVKEVGITYFSPNDRVRNSFLQEALDRYEF